jgi:hypothetical protein
MKYKGHPSANGYAPNCPKCGSWLESTENCGAPVWDKTGRVFTASATIGLGLSIPFGLPAGLIIGALCFAVINVLFAPPQPSWQCYRCRAYFQNDEVQSVAP